MCSNLGEQGNHEAHRERLLREIMNVDQVSWKVPSLSLCLSLSLSLSLSRKEMSGLRVRVVRAGSDSGLHVTYHRGIVRRWHVECVRQR